MRTDVLRFVANAQHHRHIYRTVSLHPPCVLHRFPRSRVSDFGFVAKTCRLTAILVQRFLLHLQYANHSSVGLDSAPVTHASMSVVFERVVGSLGASLSPEHFIPSKPEENAPYDASVAGSPDSFTSLDIALEGEEGREPLEVEGGPGAPVSSRPLVVPRSAECWHEA